MSPNPQEIADLVTFTEEILNGKCAVTKKHFTKNVLVWATISQNLFHIQENKCKKIYSH